MKAHNIEILICDPYRDIRNELVRISDNIKENENKTKTKTQTVNMSRFHSKNVKNNWKKR